MKTTWYITDAWQAAGQPDAIAEAIRIGEQITILLTQAITLIELAAHHVRFAMPTAPLRCQAIADQLTGEITRLAPVLARLRAARQAVIS